MGGRMGGRATAWGPTETTRWRGVDRRTGLRSRVERLVSAETGPEDIGLRGARHQHRVGVDDAGRGVVAGRPRRGRREPWRRSRGGRASALAAVAAVATTTLAALVAAVATVATLAGATIAGGGRGRLWRVAGRRRRSEPA